MTPKEKAKELVDKFNVWASRSGSAVYNPYDAKQCALICVDEIINANPTKIILGGLSLEFTTEYWIEVKQEIENHE
jgi:hypothetical protein